MPVRRRRSPSRERLPACTFPPHAVPRDGHGDGFLRALGCGLGSPGPVRDEDIGRLMEHPDRTAPAANHGTQPTYPDMGDRCQRGGRQPGGFLCTPLAGSSGGSRGPATVAAAVILCSWPPPDGAAGANQTIDLSARFPRWLSVPSSTCRQPARPSSAAPRARYADQRCGHGRHGTLRHSSTAAMGSRIFAARHSVEIPPVRRLSRPPRVASCRNLNDTLAYLLDDNLTCSFRLILPALSAPPPARRSPASPTEAPPSLPSFTAELLLRAHTHTHTHAHAQPPALRSARLAVPTRLSDARR